MTQEQIAMLRLRAKETYDVALSGAMKHMLEAEKTNTELSHPDDISRTQMAEGRRATHIRMAEVYAQIAQACQKVPGQQF